MVTFPASSAEQTVRGVIDIRYSSTDSATSYLKGGTGRFRYSDGAGVSLAQASLKYQVSWDDWSAEVIAGGYLDGENDGLGITEAFLKYRGLPNESGVRYQFRGGIIYPVISMSNIATAWLSPYSLTFSSQNTWIGEEVRHAGLEFSTDFLGKFRGSEHDFNLALSAFQYNDPVGALLAWHGWTLSSRQSFWGEKLPFPSFPALAPGNTLQNQALVSDPFMELDSDFGFHLKADWRWKGTVKLRVGHYDNKAADDIVEAGQYTWRTQFSHLGLEWLPADGWTVIAQHIQGDTRMRVADDRDVVGVDFINDFLMVSKSHQAHRYTLRYEQFNNEDFDGIWGDNNDDQGDALTLSYQYRLSPGTYLAVEYIRIRFIRPANVYQGLPVSADEQQWMTGIRFFF